MVAPEETAAAETAAAGAGAEDLGLEDPGLGGVVPFRFSCHRCGRCCTGGEGHVWLEEGEVEGMAAALGMTPEA
ncbi:MAG: hypothetical protein PVJ89_14525, partial [Planctomycetota bacterium]